MVTIGSGFVSIRYGDGLTRTARLDAIVGMEYLPAHNATDLHLAGGHKLRMADNLIADLIDAIDGEKKSFSADAGATIESLRPKEGDDRCST